MEESKNTKPQGTSEKPYKMDANVEAALSYIPLVGIAVFLMEKNNKFVRFHALQSILFWVAILIISSVMSSLRLLMIGYILSPLVSILAVGGWVFLSWKAYNNQEYDIPFIGKIARDQINK